MSKFKVAYVDEAPAEVRKFQRYARNYFDVVPITPKSEPNDTVDEILENHVDAVVSDFDLSDQDPTIHYNGAKLVSQILEQRELFPVFILTSFEDDAVSKGDDVNIIYEKSEYNNGERFLERVKNQIEKYQHRIEENEKKLLDLIEEGKKRNLLAPEEDELKRLDKFIERALDKPSALPDVVREGQEGGHLIELLQQVDDLAKKLSNDNEQI